MGVIQDLALLTSGVISGAILVKIFFPVVKTKYTVFPYDGVYYARDERGAVRYYSDDPVSAANFAVQHLTKGRTAMEEVLLQGNFEIPGPESIIFPDWTRIAIEGTLKLGKEANCTIFQNEDEVNGNEHMQLVSHGSGGELHGNRREQTADSRAVRFAASSPISHVSDVLIEGLNIHDFRHVYEQYNAVRLIDCWNTRVLGNYIHHNDVDGLEFAWGENNVVAHNVFEDNGLIHVNLWKAKNVVVGPGNTFIGGEYGIEFYLDAVECQAIRNKFYDVMKPVFFRVNSNCYHNLVEWNEIYNPLQSGIIIIHSDYNWIRYNLIQNPALSCMHLQYSSDNDIFRNWLYGSDPSWGLIFIEKESHRNFVERNEMYALPGRTGRAAIEVYPGCEDTRLYDNLIDGLIPNGINDEGTRTVRSGNVWGEVVID